MQINQFPPQYEEQRKQKAERDAHAELERSSSRQKAILDGISNPIKVGKWSNVGAVIGFAIGFCACCGMLAVGEIGSAVLSLIMVSFAGAILGMILAGIINLGHNSSVKNADKEVAEEKIRSEKTIQEIHAQAANEIDFYKNEFEAIAQRTSVKYAESALADEVINWMTEGFARTIDVADRRSHIDKLNVPFIFNVYKNKITCNLGTYDFEIKRCANLTSPLEQTAIARAIATAIQLNITMKYPKDASGTAYVLDITYSYTEKYVSAFITYTAPNGNYRSVQNW